MYSMIHDLAGRRFGKWTVTSYVGWNKTYTRSGYWECRHDCGEYKLLRGQSLLAGHTPRCRCTTQPKIERKPQHGYSKSRTYRAWLNMRRRVSNPNHPQYHYYGGRGIDICDRWQVSFVNFLADMGQAPEGLTLERINNNKGYSPENCCWATWIQQNNNRRPRIRRF